MAEDFLKLGGGFGSLMRRQDRLRRAHNLVQGGPSAITGLTYYSEH
jgi:hypothetical protein